MWYLRFGSYFTKLFISWSIYSPSDFSRLSEEILYSMELFKMDSINGKRYSSKTWISLNGSNIELAFSIIKSKYWINEVSFKASRQWVRRSKKNDCLELLQYVYVRSMGRRDKLSCKLLLNEQKSYAIRRCLQTDSWYLSRPLTNIK